MLIAFLDARLFFEAIAKMLIKYSLSWGKKQFLIFLLQDDPILWPKIFHLPNQF